MIHMRMMDPPEEINKEAEKLFNEYYGQFDDEDDDLDIDYVEGYFDYLQQHGSEELKKFLQKVDEIQREAEKNGEMV